MGCFGVHPNPMDLWACAGRRTLPGKDVSRARFQPQWSSQSYSGICLHTGRSSNYCWDKGTQGIQGECKDSREWAGGGRGRKNLKGHKVCFFGLHLFEVDIILTWPLLLSFESPSAFFGMWRISSFIRSPTNLFSHTDSVFSPVKFCRFYIQTTQECKMP